MRCFFVLYVCVVGLVAHAVVLQAGVWNQPHAMLPSLKVAYRDFATAPKTLDPARSYSADEALFLAQIVEPPLSYNPIKRPYVLQANTLVAMPAVVFYDHQGRPLAADADKHLVAYTEYYCELRQGMQYQPHPAFARSGTGWRYWPIKAAQMRGVSELTDLTETGSRVVRAEDYAYAVKRLADPRLSSPIYSYMSHKIVGLDALLGQLEKHIQNNRQAFVDLRDFNLAGVRVLNDHAFVIRIKGYDPQFLYWLGMTFFAPIPWEVDRFYAQKGMLKHHIGWTHAPVGTGAYFLSSYKPHQRIVLSRNPHYHRDSPQGDGLPMIDQYRFYLEKESIPRWVKFMQGYYDSMGVSADHFTQAISVDASGQMSLTEDMKQRHMFMQSQIEPSIFYLGFNMLDGVVGGDSESARLLRHAIGLVVDYGEYIQLFLNGRGQLAGGPIPPGIQGYQALPVDRMGAGERLNLARKKMMEAGYPNGIDPATQRPLMLYYDAVVTSSADGQAMLAWMRKQFAKIGIALQIRATRYQRFQTKIRTGKAQLFSFGWSADYPDPENFLFLFYGPNGKVSHGGENAVNYQSAQYDQMFEQLKWQADGPQRQALIAQMVALLQHDAPWLWGYFPKSLVVRHGWNVPTPINAMARDTLKYANLDPQRRQRFVVQWNQPKQWLLWVLGGGVLLFGGVLYGLYRARQRNYPIARHDEK